MQGPALTRKEQSEKDFWEHIKPLVERHLKTKIYPLENLPDTDLVEVFDKVGFDAFMVNENGHLQGLSSRMRYGIRDVGEPTFSMRYDQYIRGQWFPTGEYQRKQHALNQLEESILFPAYHVESCISNLGIAWSYLTYTKDIIRYTEANWSDGNRVRVVPIKDKDIRKVLFVDILEFQKSNKIVNLVAPTT